MPAPDCLIIGAAKAGTTSLFNILAAHPRIAASRVKETRFFSDDGRFEKGMEWYRREYFARAPQGAIRMEASPAYLTWSDKVAPRIKSSCTDRAVALVVILRDPVRRAYSHYWHRVRLGHEPLPFADAIAQEDSRLKAHWDELSRTGNGRYGYVRAGCYATRLRPYLEHFDRSRLFVLLHEDLKRDRFADAMTGLLRFLEVDDTIALKPARVNAPVEARHQGLARTYWRLKKTFAGPLYTSLVPRPLRAKVLSALFAESSYPPMDAAIEQRLRLRFAGEVEQCQALIGRDLSHWLPS